MKHIAATATYLLVGLLSCSASWGAPTFTYQFIVDPDSVVCLINDVPVPDGCVATPIVIADLGSMRITFTEEAWNRGSAEYDIQGGGPDAPPLLFVNTGVLDFDGGGGLSGLTPYFFVEEPSEFSIGYTTISVALSDFLSGSMHWLTIATVLDMQGGGVTWNGVVGSENYGDNNRFPFIGYWARVPEPSTMTLLAIALAGIAFTPRRRW